MTYAHSKTTDTVLTIQCFSNSSYNQTLCLDILYKVCLQYLVLVMVLLFEQKMEEAPREALNPNGGAKQPTPKFF